MHDRHDFSGPNDRPVLTERQSQILDLLSKRYTIKVVAAELGISDSAVNQHIRTLKVLLGVNSLSDLAAVHRNYANSVQDSTCRKTASSFSGLSAEAQCLQQFPQDDIGSVAVFHDAISYRLDAPWDNNGRTEVDPGVLNGANALWIRAAIIVALTIGIFAAVIVGVGAARGVSDILTAQSSTPKKI